MPDKLSTDGWRNRHILRPAKLYQVSMYLLCSVLKWHSGDVDNEMMMANLLNRSDGEDYISPSDPGLELQEVAE